MGRYLTLSLVLFALSGALVFADTGTDSQLSAAQAEQIQAWINPTRAALESALQKLPTLSIPEANDLLSQTFHKILDHPEPVAGNTFGYYALARALKANEILKTSGIDLQASVLWTGAEIALQEIKSSQPGQPARGRADFGIDYSLFLMTSAENAVNAQAQYELATFALGLLSVDLANDSRANQFVEASAYLVHYLDAQTQSPPQSDRDRLAATRSARQAFQLSLGALKSTSLSTAVVGTENPTLEYNRRVLRRNLDSHDAEIQAASMEKLMSLSASDDDQRRIFEKLRDPSLSICSAAYYGLKTQAHFSDALIPEVIAAISSDAVPRSCRYAAVLLTLRFTTFQIFEPLHQIYSEVIMSNRGLWYPEGHASVRLPMEVNLAINWVIFGDHGIISDVNNLCSPDLCVGDLAIVESFWKSYYGPVSKIDDQGRIQIAGAPGKWYDRKHFFKRVNSLNGLSTGDMVMTKKASPQQWQLARQVLAGQQSENVAGFYLEHTRGQIDMIFENGFVLARDMGILDMTWPTKIDELEKLTP